MSVFGIDAGRQPAAVGPGGEIQADELCDARLVRGEVSGGDALVPLAASAGAEEGARVLPDPLRCDRRDVGSPLAHPSQARLCRELTRTVRRTRDPEDACQ